MVFLAALVPELGTSVLERFRADLGMFNPEWIGKDPREDSVAEHFLVCTEDRTISPMWQRRVARERLQIEPVELATGHCPYVSCPRKLAEVLTQIAA